MYYQNEQGRIGSRQQQQQQQLQQNDENRGMSRCNDDEQSFGSQKQHNVCCSSSAPLDSPDIENVSFYEFFQNSHGPPQIIFLCLLLALSFGSVIGVVPAVMTDRLARDRYGYDDDIPCFEVNDDKPKACTQGSNLAQDYAAFCSLASNFATFITSALIGSVSDTHGRKFLLAFGIFLSLLPSLALILIQIFDHVSPLWYYGLGALGGIINWIAIAISSLSDVIPKHLRAGSFVSYCNICVFLTLTVNNILNRNLHAQGFLLAGFSLGFALSPSLALTMSHFHVSIISFLITVYAMFFLILKLPETLPRRVAEENMTRSLLRQSSYSSNNNHPVMNVLLRSVEELAILNRDSFFRRLAMLAFFSGLAISGDRSLLIYYVEDQLSFNDSDIAKLFMIVGFLGIIVQGGLLNPLTHSIGEKNVVVLSLSFGIAHNVMYGLAKTKDVIFVGVAFSTFSGLSFPTISAIKANNVDESEQGRVQGALYSIASLAAALGPLSLRSVYWKTKESTFPGVMFIFGAFLYLIATFAACSLPSSRANSTKTQTDSNRDIVEQLMFGESGPDPRSFIDQSELPRGELA